MRPRADNIHEGSYSPFGRKHTMDSISGSTESLVNLGTSMQDAQLKNALSVRTFKKGLDAQSKAAISLIESIPPVSPNTVQTGQQIDLMA